MSRSVRVLCAGALMGLGLLAAPALADPAYPPTGPGGGGGGGGTVVHTGGGGTVTPAGGGGGTVLPHTGQDIRNQAAAGLGVGLLGSALLVVAATRRRRQPVLA